MKPEEENSQLLKSSLKLELLDQTSSTVLDKEMNYIEMMLSMILLKSRPKNKESLRNKKRLT